LHTVQKAATLVNAMSSTLRERKKAATRVAIHRAARDLVEERGLGSVTIEAIAERADVAPRTFFNYYASKEEAVLGWNPDATTALVCDVRAALASGAEPLRAVQSALTALVVTEAVTSTGLQRRLALLRREPVLLAASASHWERLTDGLAAAVTSACPVERSYADLIVHVAVAAVRTVLYHWSTTDTSPVPSMELSRSVGAAFDALRAGLPTPISSFTDTPLDLES
jgi:AcrR family transcriptional regulator